MSGSSQKKLTQSEFYKLCEYIKNRKADLESTPYTFAAVARQAASALKMDVAPSTVSRAVNIVGIKMKMPLSSRHGVLQSAAIRTLARAHVQLCNSLGTNCPPEIELLAQE